MLTQKLLEKVLSKARLRLALGISLPSPSPTLNSIFLEGLGKGLQSAIGFESFTEKGLVLLDALGSERHGIILRRC